MCVGFGCVVFKENEELRLYFTKPDWYADISHTAIVTALQDNHLYCPGYCMDIECDDWTIESYDFDTCYFPAWYHDEEPYIKQRVKDILQYAYPVYQGYMKVFKPAHDIYINARKESEREYNKKVGNLLYQFEHHFIPESKFDDLHHQANIENEVRSKNAYMACRNMIDPSYYFFVAKLSVIPGYIS